MSVLDYIAGDRFIATITKSLATAPAIRWVNRYELRAGDAGGIVEIEAALDTIVIAESRMHDKKVRFDQAEMATWSPDSVPYDPAAFYTKALDVLGVVESVVDLVGLDVCCVLKRQAASGRNGMLAFRGILTTEDATGNTGEWAYTASGAVRIAALEEVFNIDMAELLGAAPFNFEVVMITTEGTYTRKVNQFVVGKIATIPRTHGYFDRGAPNVALQAPAATLASGVQIGNISVSRKQ